MIIDMQEDNAPRPQRQGAGRIVYKPEGKSNVQAAVQRSYILIKPQQLAPIGGTSQIHPMHSWHYGTVPSTSYIHSRNTVPVARTKRRTASGYCLTKISSTYISAQSP